MPPNALERSDANEARGRRQRAAIAGAALLLGIGPAARAGEQTIAFSLVTRPLEVRTDKLPGIEATTVSAGRYAGVAVFADGRIAYKEFLLTVDLVKGAGPFFGYSTYTFVDGSSLSMRFDGKLAPGKPMSAAYRIVGGTGSYAGAGGDGGFEKLDDPWENANLFRGTLRIVTP